MAILVLLYGFYRREVEVQARVRMRWPKHDIIETGGINEPDYVKREIEGRKDNARIPWQVKV